jgi:hypothetical protein
MLWRLWSWREDRHGKCDPLILGASGGGIYNEKKLVWLALGLPGARHIHDVGDAVAH